MSTMNNACRSPHSRQPTATVNSSKMAICILLTLLPALASYGSDEEKADYLYSLSLKDLLNVSLGTKSSLPLPKTPGIVAIFTQQQIEQFGFRTVEEVVSTLPSFQINPFKAGHTGFFIRGVQGRNVDKILLLIDNVPFRDVFWGNFRIDEMVPIANIERIEVLSGPGSVLYGANAFAGIISITTKQHGISLHAETGSISGYDFNIDNNQLHSDRSHNSHFRQFSGSYSSDQFHVFANVLESDGFVPERNSNGDLNPRPHDEENTHLQLKYFTDKFYLTFSYTDNTTPYQGSATRDIRFFNRKPIAISSQYTNSFENEGELTISAFYNHYEIVRRDLRYKSEPLAQKNTLTRDRKAHRIGYLTGIDSMFLFTLFESHQITSGISFLGSKPTETFQDDTIFDDAGNVTTQKTQLLLKNEFHHETSLFIQDLWNINEDQLITFGVRLSSLSDFDNELNWRLGYTTQFEQLHFKLLAGTAYRVPVPREYLKDYGNGVDTPIDLDPENLLTIEAQLGYNYTNGNITATLFKNTYTNFIKEAVTVSVDNAPINDEYGFNFDEIDTLGFELSASFHKDEQWSILLSASKLIIAEETPGELGSNIVLDSPIAPETEDIKFLSDITLSVVGQYQLTNQWNTNIHIIYNSDRNFPKAYQQDSNFQDRSNANEFVTINVGLNYQITEDIYTNLFIKNITNSRLYGSPVDAPDEYDNEYGGRMLGVGVKVNW
jgi:outer membrane receptor for ferrienterochelin and colicin